MYIGRGHIIQNGLRFPLLRCKYRQNQRERRNHYTHIHTLYYDRVYASGGYDLRASTAGRTDVKVKMAFQ